MFNAEVKKYDPDDELEAPRSFPTIAAAIAWVKDQRPFGYYAGWVEDGKTHRRVEMITPEEIEANKFLPAGERA